MATDDESQVAEDFGMMARMITGSAMQIRESQLRRRAMHDQRAQAEAAVEDRNRAAQERMQANAGRVIQHDLYSREFWRTANSESIADRLAVAAALGEDDPAARSAWMHGADVLRTEYGIDIQEINRENPSSLADRHAALRDALDDHFAQYQQDRADDAAVGSRRAEAEVEAEADKRETETVKTESETPDQEPMFFFHDRSTDREDIRAVDKQGALAAIDDLPADVAEKHPEVWADVQGWRGRDADVDRAMDEKFPQPEEETTADTSGVAARGEQRQEAQEAKADAARAEHLDDLALMHRRDMAHLNGIQDKQLSSVRRVQLSSFPNEPHVVDPAKLHRAPKKARQSQGQNRERQEVLAR